MADFWVWNTKDSGAGSLRQAILNSNASNGADRIKFHPFFSVLSSSTINLTSGQIEIKDDLIIEGLGADKLTIDAGRNSRIFLVRGGFNGILSGPGPTTDVTIKGLTLTGGFASSDGGAIFADDSLTSRLNLSIEDIVITENEAIGNGGGIFVDKSMRNPINISGSTISKNVAFGGGGGIFSGDINISSSTISENFSILGGGGVFSVEDTRIIESTFSENVTLGLGGGLAGARIISLRSTFDNNFATLNGGAIRTQGETIILDSNISNNRTNGNGGGLSIGGFSDLYRGSNTTTSIINSTISGNEAKGNGGGIEVIGGRIRLWPISTDLGWSNDLLATNVTITNNLADSDNDGEGDGGGIWNTQSGVFGDYSSKRFLLSAADIVLKNSIIAGNFDTPNNNGVGYIAPDISGAARGNANNLVGNIQGRIIDREVATPGNSIGQGSDIISAEPGLGPLQDNGGLTLTHALLPDSLAINGGNNNLIREALNIPIYYDQRGSRFSRIVGGIVDIGAFEVQSDLNLKGSSGDDNLLGSEGKDTLIGYGGNDELIGLAGDDLLLGGEGDDSLFGGLDDDTLAGFAGDDILLGGEGDDSLFGLEGDDSLIGLEGNDTLTGGEGDDILFGGSGDDILLGDAGRDVFLLEVGKGRDTIMDFQDGIDILALHDEITFADLIIENDSAGTSTIIKDIDNNEIVVLADFDFTLITEADFYFYYEE